MKVKASRRLVLACCVFAASAVCASAEPVEKTAAPPRVFYTRPGQFEIVAFEDGSAQQALALGRSVWRALEGPFGLPSEGFVFPVSVRLVPSDLWKEGPAFVSIVEPPGRVMVRVRWSADVDPAVVRRAFVQGLILEKAVSWHGVKPGLAAPLWLEHAAVLWSMGLENPAMMDQFRQESLGGFPPPLSSVLSWRRDDAESRLRELSSLWAFVQLQEESRDAGGARWQGWLRRILGGADAYETLAAGYPGLWPDKPALELWWRTAYQHQSRSSELPVMTANDSRSWLGRAVRWLGVRGGRETPLGLEELRGLRAEAWVRAELTRRMAQTRSIMRVIHPYYANTAVSLGRLYEKALTGGEADFLRALADFEREATDARELEDETGAMLDTAPRK